MPYVLNLQSIDVDQARESAPQSPSTNSLSLCGSTNSWWFC